MGLEFVYLEDVIVFWAWPYILQLFSDDQIQIESLIDGVYSFKFMISHWPTSGSIKNAL